MGLLRPTYPPGGAAVKTIAPHTLVREARPMLAQRSDSRDAVV